MKPQAKHWPFLLAGALIGLLLTLQMKSDVLKNSSYAFDEYELQKVLVESFMTEQKGLEAQLSQLHGQVAEEEARISHLYRFIDSDTLNQTKARLGLTERTGEGLEIVLDDGPEGDISLDPNSLIHASDLRDVLNLLRAFPNQGIAINGQRIVASTPISSAGNSLLINNFNLTTPLTIRMVTEVPDLVIQRLSSTVDLPSLHSRTATHQLTFKFKKKNELTLPPYLGDYPTWHLTSLDVTPSL